MRASAMPCARHDNDSVIVREMVVMPIHPVEILSRLCSSLDHSNFAPSQFYSSRGRSFITRTSAEFSDLDIVNLWIVWSKSPFAFTECFLFRTCITLRVDFITLFTITFQIESWMYWLIDGLIDRLIDWLIDELIDVSIRLHQPSTPSDVYVWWVNRFTMTCHK